MSWISVAPRPVAVPAASGSSHAETVRRAWATATPSIRPIASTRSGENPAAV